jgi:hypothetical protein
MVMSFVHIKKTPNTGDLACTPFHYFDFPEAQSYDIHSEIPKSDIVVFGGGAIEPYFKDPHFALDKVEAKHKVAWGIGSSRSGRKKNDPFAVEGFDLVGIREYEREGGIYVPCVSCMSEYFDLDYEVLHDAVFYKHAAKPVPEEYVAGLPTMDNRASLEDAIAFMGSAETVITNSFHGTYWATLLNRKVICLPFSSKFYAYKFAPTYSKAETWRADRRKATTHPEALEDCRDINKMFYGMVMNLK